KTLDVVEASRFSSAFMFQYSPRPGTPAAEMDDQIPKAVVQERFERLVALQDRIAAEENAKKVGAEVNVLIAEGEGDRDSETHRISGRAEDGRLVHVALPEGYAEEDRPRPGDVVRARVTKAAPFYLIADSGAEGGEFEVRRTRSGDAWERRANGDEEAASCGTPGPGGPVSLGLPSLRRPER
ncbi:MAG: tRNA (N6-isopentenyl adenosine(37)-C2)-methylthiotransferase MiaB, partial [Dermabacter sp.]|nr:tRNA (N6-isopentenyl adenosine(37)-C2)-methylthiotransferase MiaB [Dermabacter sp.]